MTSHPDGNESKLTLRFKNNMERDLFTLAFRVLKERAPLEASLSYEIESEEAKAAEEIFANEDSS